MMNKQRTVKTIERKLNLLLDGMIWMLAVVHTKTVKPEGIYALMEKMQKEMKK